MPGQGCSPEPGAVTASRWFCGRRVRLPAARSAEPSHCSFVTIDSIDDVSGGVESTVVRQVVGQIGELDPPGEGIARNMVDVVLVGLTWAACQRDNSVNDIGRHAGCSDLIDGHRRVFKHVVQHGDRSRPKARDGEHHAKGVQDVGLRFRRRVPLPTMSGTSQRDCTLQRFRVITHASMLPAPPLAGPAGRSASGREFGYVN